MVLSRQQNSGQNSKKTRANRSCEIVVKLKKYLRTSVTNQNNIHGEIKCRLSSDNVCYRLVKDILYSRPQPKNVKIRIYEAMVFACSSVWVSNLV
jgi:hypothetical protein